MENEVIMYYHEDAVEYIRSRSGLSVKLINTVLELEMDYMKSIGLIYEMDEK